MKTLELRCLGGLSIYQDGRPLTALKSQKGQALLCYLALTGKGHGRSALAGLLWPEMSEENALMNLRNVLNKVNQHLRYYLLITRQSIALNPDVAYWLDVTEFEAGLGVKGDIGRLQTAVALYEGDFLEGFDLDDAPHFEGWVLGQRARLREAVLVALHRLITHFAGRDDYETAISYARQLLSIEPWREEAHRELMRLLALSGQRSAALVQYETCRRVLAEELDVEPTPATVELYQQIKDNKVVDGRRGLLDIAGRQSDEVTDVHRATLLPGDVSIAQLVTPSPPHLVTLSPPHNLPAQATPLIGRESELAKLNQIMSRPDGRLLTIVGAGGMGKTRLALAVAAQQITTSQRDNPFSNGVYFVPLAPLGEAGQILTTLAQAIGFQLQANDPRQPMQQVLDYLRRKRMLLLFDNFEHVLEGAALLVAILQTAPQVEILVTSREPLRLYEEQLFMLEGLAFSAEAAIETDAAVQLFLQRAQWTQPDFVLQESDRPHLTAICRQTGGNPLALELAAAWIDTLTPVEIAGELEQSLDLLRTKWRNVPDRHQSIRATFELSWQRLTGEEQQIFGRLSVFRGGFTRAAAWQVCAPEMSQPVFQRILAVLAGKSFLRTVSVPDRYGLHELLRQFAAEKLAEEPDEEMLTHDRHSDYYCNFLYEHTADWHTAQQLETLAMVTCEASNAQPALHWALAQGEWQRLLQAIDSWAWFHRWNGRYSDGGSFFQGIVNQATKQMTIETAVSSDCLLLRAKALVWQAEFNLYDNANILSLFEQSLALLEQLEGAGLDSRPEKAFLLRTQGSALMNRFADIQMSQLYYKQALTLYQELNDQWGIAGSLMGLGMVDLATGHFASVLDNYQAALAIQQVLGDRRKQSECLNFLGHAYNALGQLDEAEQLQREAISLVEQIGDRLTLISHKASLAMTLSSQGKFEEAHLMARESLVLCQDMGYPLLEDWVLRTLGETLLHVGQYLLARQHATRALAVIAETGLSRDGRLFGLLGNLALVAFSYAEAQEAFTESKKIAYENGVKYRAGLAAAGLGYAACLLGQWPQARQHLAEALTSTLLFKAYMPTIYTLPGVALLLAASGDMVRAVEIWAQAKCHPFVANSKWFEDVAGRELEALTASLPLKVVETARERGRTLDLWETAEALLTTLRHAA